MHRALLLLACLWMASGSVGWGGEDLGWERIQLDARFRSEGVAAADLNNDGRLDVVTGDVWYEAPHWTMHEIRRPGDYWAGVGYSQSFCNWTYDVNQDGRQDVIIVGFPGEPFHWYENPQQADAHWKPHVIWHSICNETPLFHDVTGDGRPELVLGSQPEAQMGYIEIPTGEAVYQKWNFVPISEPGDPAQNGTFKYYHGLGATDVDGDRHVDVVIPHGWWRNPGQPGDDLWVFHPHRLSETEGGAPLTGADIYAHDLDGDGDRDFLMSSAHRHGVWWFEAGEAEQAFRFHVIDDAFSQTHALHFVDVNGDGQPDLVTGKRYYAHNGGDPGGNDPVGMYWYEIRREEGKPPQFLRHEIMAGRDTGVGTQFAVADMNADGKIDLVLSNKKGVNVLLQRGSGLSGD